MCMACTYGICVFEMLALMIAVQVGRAHIADKPSLPAMNSMVEIAQSGVDTGNPSKPVISKINAYLFCH